MKSEIKERYLSRLDELILQWESLPTDSQQESASIGMDGEATYRTEHFMKLTEFVAWRTFVSSVLDVVVPRGSIHRKAVDDFPKFDNELVTIDGFAFAIDGAEDNKQGVPYSGRESMFRTEFAI